MGVAAGAAVSEAIREIVAFPFYALGWIVGEVARALAWMRDALIAGYKDGRE